MNQPSKKYALTTIFAAIFVDILAFGMVIPLSPILARDFGADGLQVGLLISVYSLTQFFFAPLWGRLSDSLGRKPVLLFGLFGTALAHIFFAFSLSFIQLFFSRILAGFFGGNLAVAKAYIADVTDPKERSKNMGLIGLAFGLGFTLGPALGFLFIFIGKAFGTAPPYGESFAALGAALVCCLNFAAGFFTLKERRRLKKPLLRQTGGPSLFSRPPLWSVWRALRAPRLGLALFMSFLLWLALAQLEPTLILLVQDDFGWRKTGAYGGFAFIGFLMVFSQGVLVRKLIPRRGERQISQWGLLLLSAGLFFIGGSVLPAGPPAPGIFSLALGVILFSVGYSLADTSLSGILSLLSPEEEQGKIFGVNQSLSSLARIAGPALGGWLYRDVSHSAPFFAAGVMGAGAFFLALRKGKGFPDKGRSQREGAARPEEIPLYAIDKFQLKSLLEKNISFCFFQLESLPPSGESEADFLIKKAGGQKTEREALAILKEKGFSQPAVFLCRDGRLSEEASSRARGRGYQNVYYVHHGLKGLLAARPPSK